MHIPRVVIAGTHSGVGKTMLATALMRALTQTGYNVQPFKVGPDYIDPGYHSAATGMCSRNLDVWMVGEKGVKELFYRSAMDADISVVEGVMGLFDGRGAGDEGSTSHIARLLEAPVVLIMDVRSMSRSAAAVVTGFKNFDSRIKLGGLILNRVGSHRHFKLLKQAIESSTSVPVLGRIEFDRCMELPERHLGLIPSLEKDNLGELLDLMAVNISRSIDIDGIIELAKSAPPAKHVKSEIFSDINVNSEFNLGVVIDDAFNFYYQDGLDLLISLGARIISCSAIRDSFPQHLDGLYVGGGFPEIFAGEISKNRQFLEGVKTGFLDGMPIYAECGGMMLLSEAIVDLQGREHSMVGVIPSRTVMLKKRAGLGYVSAISRRDNLLVRSGEIIKGHEFHYSILEELNGDDYAFTLNRQGDEPRLDGYVSGNLLASYLHLHFCGCRQQAARFVDSCIEYRKKRLGL